MGPTLKDIAYELNELSVTYKIGQLQQIRKDIKKMAHRAGSSIFSDQTIDEDYAFHHGGRTEIQFNIGFEETGFRYGLAFSLEPSFSLPNIDVLNPKILMFNCLVREYPEYFSNYKMWHFLHDVRSENYPVSEIKSDLIISGTFIFFGKIIDCYRVNYDHILETFDDLLDVYIKVEAPYIHQPKDSKFSEDHQQQFVFVKRTPRLPYSRSYTTVAKDIDIDVHHTYLQKKLQHQLEQSFGADNVCLEHDCYGNSIDIVTQDNQGYLRFYEIKTASSARSCIRQAIGQLFEYAFGNGQQNAIALIVAGEPPLDYNSQVYLDFLRSQFGLPIEYLQIT